MAGLVGLEPIPRKRALLSFRAVNSVKYDVGREYSRLANDANPGALDDVLRDCCDAQRKLLNVFGLLLCRHGHLRETHAQQRIGLLRVGLLGLSSVGWSWQRAQNGQPNDESAVQVAHHVHIVVIRRQRGPLRFQAIGHDMPHQSRPSFALGPIAA